MKSALAEALIKAKPLSPSSKPSKDYQMSDLEDLLDEYEAGKTKAEKAKALLAFIKRASD